MGRSIGVLIGASVLVGLVGALFGSSMGGGSIRRGPRPGSLPQRYPAGPTAVATLTAADTTARTLDENDAESATVVSFTESARIARRRAKRERREVASA